MKQAPVNTDIVPFNKPYMTGRELHYISQAHANGHMAGDGLFSKACERWLEQYCGCEKAFLTHSCTAALEMAALLADLEPGDEVIMPSFTFVSTANAFLLRGAVPVFVDIREDTLNLNESLIEEALSERTRAIVVVHYAGVACEMDRIRGIADRHDVMIIEDNAHGLGSFYNDKPLGSLGTFSALSFHETKNVISGEGGALLINDEDRVQRAEIVREKGTNRSAFFRGQIDKYTWVDIGSSYLPSDIIAAFLMAQLESADEIMNRRLAIWDRYHDAFEAAERSGSIRRPMVPEHCRHNAHMYYLLLPDLEKRSRFISTLGDHGIQAVFHYVPLHSSPMGRESARCSGNLAVTSSVSERLVRLPFWLGIEPTLDRIFETALDALES